MKFTHLNENWKILRRNTFAVAGAIVILLLVAMAVLAPLIAPHNPNRLDSKVRLQAPGRNHPLGTDRFGRDVLSQIIYGARVSLTAGFSASLFATVVGSFIGILAGYYRRADNLLMRVMDGLMAFPSILLAIAIMAALGPWLINVIIALGVVYAPRIARIARGVVLVSRELGYVEAAVSAGAKDLRILRRHILPNCMQPILVQATFVFAYAILAEAALSFLGVGVPPDVPSWGAIISEGRNYIRIAPWLTLSPGIVIVLAVMGLNLLGDGMRDLVDPHLRQ